MPILLAVDTLNWLSLGSVVATPQSIHLKRGKNPILHGKSLSNICVLSLFHLIMIRFCIKNFKTSVKLTEQLLHMRKNFTNYLLVLILLNSIINWCRILSTGYIFNFKTLLTYSHPLLSTMFMNAPSFQSNNLTDEAKTPSPQTILVGNTLLNP